MDTSKWLLSRTERFPKKVRHTLSHRIDDLTLGLLEGITTLAYRRDRRDLLRTLDDQLNRLRVLLRLAHELGFLAHNHYEEAARRLAEAGRLLHGLGERQRAETQTADDVP